MKTIQIACLAATAAVLFSHALWANGEVSTAWRGQNTGFLSLHFEKDQPYEKVLFEGLGKSPASGENRTYSRIFAEDYLKDGLLNTDLVRQKLYETAGLVSKSPAKNEAIALHFALARLRNASNAAEKINKVIRENSRSIYHIDFVNTPVMAEFTEPLFAALESLEFARQSPAHAGKHPVHKYDIRLERVFPEASNLGLGGSDDDVKLTPSSLSDMGEDLSKLDPARSLLWHPQSAEAPEVPKATEARLPLRARAMTAPVPEIAAGILARDLGFNVVRLNRPMEAGAAALAVLENGSSGYNKIMFREHRALLLFNALIANPANEHLCMEFKSSGDQTRVVYAACNMDRAFNGLFLGDLVIARQSVPGKSVEIAYKTAGLDELWKVITFNDVKWFARLVSHMSGEQVTAAFETAGYSGPELEQYTAAFMKRRAQLITYSGI